ncbi:MAG: TonB family protein [Reyranella sp.]|uniref:energy transducer TonB family protein n=1 Tax=Reyranella sp. TaxID=1929291 RepID=UPI001AC694C0|nr:energy transducer TonB [Reyranella sp.]MBN9085684.1 TonB family protein [Reyranella sp.]
MMTWAAFLSDEIAERRGRLPSVAAILSGLLHAGLIGAAFAQLPWTSPEASAWGGVDVTIAFAPQVEEVSASALEPQAVTPDPAPATQLLLSEPAPAEASSAGDVPETALQPSIAAEPPQPDVSAALAPEQPSLEKMVPATDAPPAVDAHDFARAKPIPASPPAQHRPQVAAVQLPSARHGPPDVRPVATAPSGPPPAAALKSDAAQQKAEEDYLYQIVRKISQYRFYSRSQENVPRGLVVTRMTIARDGRLLDVALVKSSGFPNLDNAVVETIRLASPFAPLPGDLAQDRKTFIVPVNYTRER